MSEDNFSSSRIAKNTIALYVRSFIIMFIGLFSSRILLRALGVEDYGIYNVVGGVVVFFSFLNSSMMAAAQRFMNYEMGKGDSAGVNRVFCMSVNIMTILAIVICLITDGLGFLLLHTKMNIPLGRMPAAEWVLHLSVIATFFSIISIPYNALIIAKEDMKSFAYVDIMGTLMKFLVVLCLEYLPFDSLITYSIAVVVIQCIVRFVYAAICHHKFEESSYHYLWDSKLFKEMMGFTSWTTLASLVMVGKNQGVSILYNAFYGVAINAAIGIASQVNNALNKLVSNFTTSFNPQITKTYASGEWDKCERLHRTGPKFAFTLLSLGAVPVLLNTEPILTLWLKNVPEHSVMFVRLILLSSLFTSLVCTSNTLVRATGKVRSYEICGSLIQFATFAMVYVCLRASKNVYLPYVVLVIGEVIYNTYHAYRACRAIKLSTIRYIGAVQLRMLLSFVVTIGFSLIIFMKSDGIFALIFNVCISIVVSGLCSHLIGFDKEERGFINRKLSSMLSKLKRK